MHKTSHLCVSLENWAKGCTTTPRIGLPETFSYIPMSTATHCNPSATIPDSFSSPHLPLIYWLVESEKLYQEEIISVQDSQETNSISIITETLPEKTSTNIKV